MTLRFIKVDDNGALLAADAAQWAAVLDTTTGLMWDTKARPVESFQAAQAVPGTLNVAGFSDWRTPTVEELFCLADRSRLNPAIDTDVFPDTPSEWFWTSTVEASSPSDCAWVVNFGNGGSDWDGQDYEGFVRAVRSGGGGMTIPNDPAFPIGISASGLTKREYFAALALEGIIRNASQHVDFDWYAQCAVRYADALIAELAKPKEEK